MLFLYVILFILNLFSFRLIKDKRTDLDKQTSQFLKGICALLIVIHHISMIYCYDINAFDFTNTSFLSQFIAWGSPIVCIFFFISGFGLMKKVNITNNAIISLEQRLFKLFLPIIIISLIYFIILNLIGVGIDINILSEKTFLPNSWYCYVIAYLYIIFFVLLYFTKNQKFIIAALLLSSVMFIFFMIILNWSSYWYKSIIVFNIGTIYAFYEEKINVILNSYLGLILLLSLLIIYGIITLNISFVSNTTITNINNFFISLLCPILILPFCLNWELSTTSIFAKILKFIGSISYEIYLIHGCVIYFIQLSNIDNIFLIIFLVYTITILVALGINKLCQFFFNKGHYEFYSQYIKRFLDIILSGFALLVLSPIVLILWIWLTFANKGAGALFFQERPGKDGKIFRVVKFKTMTDERDENGNLLPDEKRLTKVGKFVRSTSLDELPQLLNVLKGDMSLIGPRPLLPEYLPLYSPEQSRRHEVRPGITGWAQVNGRNVISWTKRFELDVWYVDNMSFLLDIKIFFLTIKKVFIREGINSATNATMEDFNGTN